MVFDYNDDEDDDTTKLSPEEYQRRKAHLKFAEQKFAEITDRERITAVQKQPLAAASGKIRYTSMCCVLCVVSWLLHAGVVVLSRLLLSSPPRTTIFPFPVYCTSFF